ncbi:calcium-binding protein [Leisingera sp. MMG026]|uniref:calcium-binding protein n=1 Tax=Leisingera sp. MMG026 TaxID=2909982 RepID=UPI001F46446C|nr:calcium-binding protein [Leisingera sp. MMG026]MCF6429532.1 hypothetical protein [Leisingera sp. MMG026]
MELLILLGIGLTIGGVAIALDDDDDGITKGDTTADATEDNDDLAGGSGEDTIFAKDGDDIVDGNAGNDRLFGQGGQDLLIGGEGDDFLRGGSDHDSIIDGTGSDTLIGDAGNDFIVSTSAFDPDNVVEAGREWAANDDPDVDVQLEPELNHDTDEDADVIQAGGGNDDVIAGNGDTVSLGEGLDELILGDWIEAGDEPVVLTDYSRLEDVIVYSHDGEGTPPEITVENTLDQFGDEDDALLLADGEVFARIQGAGGLITAGNVMVLTRA